MALNNELARLHDQLVTRMIGYSPQSLVSHSASGFPPSDVVKVEDDSWRLEIAVPGWKRDMLSVSLTDNVLTVEGEKRESPDNEEFLQHGVSRKAFKKQWTVGPNIELDRASLEDGILYISVYKKTQDDKIVKLEIL